MLQVSRASSQISTYATQVTFAPNTPVFAPLAWDSYLVQTLTETCVACHSRLPGSSAPRSEAFVHDVDVEATSHS